MVQRIKNPHSAIIAWLLTCAALVFVMTLIGAITRLTESGLSIVYWKPVGGAIPPLTHAQWLAEFELYKTSPEFQHKNFWMSLDDFKLIFFWEWFHRLFGRLLGLAYALPLLWFWLRGMVPAGFKGRLLFILALGLAQGFMGWYMVASGLVDRPAVSHFRLAAHLGLAIIIGALCYWTALDLLARGKPRQAPPSPALYAHGWATLYLIGLTVIWGAFVAGLDAGMIYNEFPLMGEGFLPPEALRYDPLWAAFFQDHAAVQFAHRWLGILTVLMVVSYWEHANRRGSGGRATHLLLLAALAQAGLGIATLLSVVYLPLAVLHQAGALILLGVMLYILHAMTRAGGLPVKG